MKAQVRLIAFVTIFIAIFTLFFIFDNLYKVGERCRIEVTEFCKKLQGFSITTIAILLMVGVLSLIVCTVIYIVLTFR